MEFLAGSVWSWDGKGRLEFRADGTMTSKWGNRYHDPVMVFLYRLTKFLLVL